MTDRARRDLASRCEPLIVRLKLHADLLVVDPQIAIAPARHGIRHDRLHFLRHHADIGLLAAIVSEAIEAEAVVEMAEQLDAMLELDIRAPATTAAAAATAATTTETTTAAAAESTTAAAAESTTATAAESTASTAAAPTAEAATSPAAPTAAAAPANAGSAAAPVPAWAFQPSTSNISCHPRVLGLVDHANFVGRAAAPLLSGIALARSTAEPVAISPTAAAIVIKTFLIEIPPSPEWSLRCDTIEDWIA